MHIEYIYCIVDVENNGCSNFNLFFQREKNKGSPHWNKITQIKMLRLGTISLKIGILYVKFWEH
jgi:hypothetical protein